MNFAEFLKKMVCGLAAFSATVALGDTGVINGDGKVFLFYADGDSVVVRECAPLTLLENRESCSDEQGGREFARVSAPDFVSELKGTLSLPLNALQGTYPDSMGRKVELYRLGSAQDTSARIAQLRNDLSAVNKKLQEIRAFTDRYGRESAGSYLDKETSLENRKKELEGEMENIIDPTPVVNELNQRIESLVGEIGQAPLDYSTLTLRQGSFEYHLLINYVDNFAGMGMRFAPITAGKFTMGSPESERYRNGRDEKQVPVELTQDFEMQTTEVTQLQWFREMGENPSRFKSEKHCGSEHRVMRKVELCPNHPVERVSWNDVQDFIGKLNRKNDGYTYRLPTEAEWEYAARGGTTTAYSFGNSSDDLSAHGWYWGNSGERTHRVGQKRPNPWGLYDVHGNVWEWVQDAYAGELQGGTDPLQGDGRYRVVRGGGWDYHARNLRSAYRYGVNPGSRSHVVGVRLLRTPVKL